ncbi:MAG: hypothetical protein ACK5ZV_04230 [bacterium]
MNTVRVLNTVLLLVTALWAVICAWGHFWAFLFVRMHLFGTASDVEDAGILSPRAMAAMLGESAEASRSAGDHLTALLLGATSPPSLSWLFAIVGTTLLACAWFGLFPNGVPSRQALRGSAPAGTWRPWASLTAVVLTLNLLLTGGTVLLSERFTRSVEPGTTQVIARLVSSGALTSTTMPDEPWVHPEHRHAALDARLFFGPPLAQLERTQSRTTQVGVVLAGAMLLTIGIAAAVRALARSPEPKA